MQQIITIKEITRPTAKNGKQYIKIQAKEGNKYYNYFGKESSITQSLKAGTEMQITVENTQDGKFSNITNIKSILQPEDNAEQSSGGGAGSTSNPDRRFTPSVSAHPSKREGPPGYHSASPEEPSFDIEQNIDIAVALAKRELGIHPEIESVAQNLVSELMRERFELWKSKEIAKAKELEWERDKLKIKAYGKA